MTQTESGHLIDILAEVPDPRNAKGAPLACDSCTHSDCDDVWVSQL